MRIFHDLQEDDNSWILVLHEFVKEEEVHVMPELDEFFPFMEIIQKEHNDHLMREF